MKGPEGSIAARFLLKTMYSKKKPWHVNFLLFWTLMCVCVFPAVPEDILKREIEGIENRFIRSYPEFGTQKSLCQVHCSTSCSICNHFLGRLKHTFPFLGHLKSQPKDYLGDCQWPQKILGVEEYRP